MSEAELKRVFKHIQKQPGEDGCWLWLGNRLCQITIAGKPRYVRRLLYKHFIGEIGKRSLERMCDEPDCVRPEHRAPLRKINELSLKAKRGGRPRQDDPFQVFVNSPFIKINRKTGCWMWQGDDIKKAMFHCYTLFFVESASGGTIQQTCGVQNCVNPLHLGSDI